MDIAKKRRVLAMIDTLMPEALPGRGLASSTLLERLEAAGDTFSPGELVQILTNLEQTGFIKTAGTLGSAAIARDGGMIITAVY